MQYFILHGDKEEGPFEKEQLLSMLEKGEIIETTPYATSGMAQWKPVGELREEAHEEASKQADKELSWLIVILGMVVSLSIIVVIGAWPGSSRGAAGRKAIAHIVDQIPGGDAKCKILAIDQDNELFTVAVQVDAKNVMGGWIRKTATVKLEKERIGFAVINWKIED